VVCEQRYTRYRRESSHQSKTTRGKRKWSSPCRPACLCFDFSRDIPNIKATTLIVAADADIFPPAHAVELFGFLGGGLRDGGWDGAGRPKSKLAILPGLTHYNIFSDPALAATVILFLDEPAATGR
jgi:pimeloyl-ACP methyl ester carboxylesterase